MKLSFKVGLYVAIVPLALLSANYAAASTCTGTVTLPATCTGTLDSESGTPGSVVDVEFTLTTASAVTIYTTSYGGGTNLNGTVTPAGGFQPNITLFNSAGFDIANQSPSFSPIANPDPTNGWKGDGYMQDTDVAAGTYYITLTDWQNQMSITSTGLNTSAAAYTQFSGPGGTSFTDVQGNTRTGNYALDIEATPLAPTAAPEPATFALMLPALAAAALCWRRRQNQAS